MLPVYCLSSSINLIIILLVTQYDNRMDMGVAYHESHHMGVKFSKLILSGSTCSQGIMFCTGKNDNDGKYTSNIPLCLAGWGELAKSAHRVHIECNVYSNFSLA